MREEIATLIENHVRLMRDKPSLPNYQGKLGLAAKILRIQCEEIEKVGLLNEKGRIKAVGRFYSGGSYGLERLAQAQLQKILKILKEV